MLRSWAHHDGADLGAPQMAQIARTFGYTLDEIRCLQQAGMKRRLVWTCASAMSMTMKQTPGGQNGTVDKGEGTAFIATVDVVLAVPGVDREVMELRWGESAAHVPRQLVSGRWGWVAPRYLGDPVPDLLVGEHPGGREESYGVVADEARKGNQPL